MESQPPDFLDDADVPEDPEATAEAKKKAKIGPHNLDAEAAVVSAIMLSSAALDAVTGFGLQPLEFYSQANRRMYEAALWLSENGKPVDLVTVKTRLDETGWLRTVGFDYMIQLVENTPSVAHPEEYAAIVRDKAVRRAVILACELAAAEGYQDKGPAAEYADRAEQAMYQIARAPTAVGLENVDAIQRRVFAEIVDRAQRGERITGTPTGFERLDAKMAGLHDGELTTVAGRPGMGKTSFVMNVAVNVASVRKVQLDGRDEVLEIQGVAVAVFSLEMGRDALMSRVLCCEGRVDSNKMRQGFLQDRDWNNLTNAAAYVSSLPIWIDDTPDLNHLQIRSKVRRLQSEIERTGQWKGAPCKRVGLVVIDYMQLMTPVGENLHSRQQEIGSITRALKRLAKEMRIPVVALAQLNRASELRGANGRRPQLSDLREAGDIEQDSDNIVFIYRDDYYEAESDERGIAELIVAKQRNGPTGKVKVRFESAYTRFDNLAPGEAPDEENAA